MVIRLSSMAAALIAHQPRRRGRKIMRFVRHRMQPLDEWPLSVKA
jgi:hypothetical protein